MLNKININNHTLILDCGCGSGKVIKFLNKKTKYIGIDINVNFKNPYLEMQNLLNLYSETNIEIYFEK